MKLVLICDEEKIFEGEVTKVQVKTENGMMEILPYHQPYMSRIFESVAYFPSESKDASVDITEGFVYTDGDTCFVVVDK